jgi:hypothetical protein
LAIKGKGTMMPKTKLLLLVLAGQLLI